MGTLPFILGFGLPSQLQTEPENPHCLNLTWKKAPGPVTGYRVYCYSGDSQQAEIIKDINDSNLEMAVISGLKPETMYRVGLTSVSSGIESNLAFSEEKVKLRKFIRNNLFFDIYAKSNSCKKNKPYYVFSWNSSLSLGSESCDSKEKLNNREKNWTIMGEKEQSTGTVCFFSCQEG